MITNINSTIYKSEYIDEGSFRYKNENKRLFLFKIKYLLNTVKTFILFFTILVSLYIIGQKEHPETDAAIRICTSLLQIGMIYAAYALIKSNIDEIKQDIKYMLDVFSDKE